MNEHLCQGRPVSVCARCGGPLFTNTAKGTLDEKDYHFYCLYKVQHNEPTSINVEKC